MCPLIKVYETFLNGCVEFLSIFNWSKKSFNCNNEWKKFAQWGVYLVSNQSFSREVSINVLLVYVVGNREVIRFNLFNTKLIKNGTPFSIEFSKKTSLNHTKNQDKNKFNCLQH